MPWVGHYLSIEGGLQKVYVVCSCGWSRRARGEDPHSTWRAHLIRERAAFRHSADDVIYDFDDNLGLMRVMCLCGWQATDPDSRMAAERWDAHYRQASAREGW
ncbi:hypothetical protein ACIBEJ_24385 [Nonomuraea sp. NPDC050790]|uniref:hypothetical protein n=1 Tax=Nonomuraea sp. NPDC050790 TaxID=3364371 RepID=UPI0037B45BDD